MRGRVFLHEDRELNRDVRISSNLLIIANKHRLLHLAPAAAATELPTNFKNEVNRPLFRLNCESHKI